jgi:gliding motility-associated-like protein
MKRLPLIVFFLVVFFKVCCSGLSHAQLCQGSLGAPIVNKTFGAGSSPGTALAASTTNYTYVSNDCPNDGFYTVRGNTSNCFGGSWHTLSADHTGDAGGYFMLVNASVQPGAFYTDTVKGLCAGTTFEFAAWVANVMRPSACGGNGTRPNLTFSIEKTDGSIIQQYSSGDINQTPSLQWVQYGFFFITPAGVTDVVLRIVNNAPGGCGNDLALDDITFRPCGPLVTTAITSTGGNSAAICEGQGSTYNLSSTISNGYTNPVFQWQSSFNGGAFVNISGATVASLPVIIPSNASSGVYTYRVLASEAGNINNVGCRVNSSVVTITVEPLPTISFNTNAPICANSNLQIAASSIATTYQWNGPGGFSASTNSVTINNAQTNSSGKYYLLASTTSCSYYDSITVAVNPVPLATINISAITICEEDTVQLIAAGGSSYLWQPTAALSVSSSAVTKAFPISSTTYNAIVSNSFNCSDTAAVDITVIKKASANAGPDLFTIVGNPIQIQAIAAGDNITYSWTPSTYLDSPFALKPVVNAPAGVYNYRLLVASAVGCGFAPDEVKVTVYDKLYIPSAFTPNNDGKNDRWIIPALHIFPSAEVFIYNRYGEMIFRENGSFNGWDGKYKGLPVPTGSYIYMVKPGSQSQPKLLKGIITVIR